MQCNLFHFFVLQESRCYIVVCHEKTSAGYLTLERTEGRSDKIHGYLLSTKKSKNIQLQIVPGLLLTHLVKDMVKFNIILIICLLGRRYAKDNWFVLLEICFICASK